MRKKQGMQRALLRLSAAAICAIMALAALYYFAGIDPRNIAGSLQGAARGLQSRMQSTVDGVLSSLPSPQSGAPDTVPIETANPGAAPEPERPAPLPQEGVFNYIALDVGQGDSHLLIAPGGETMLIDAGDTEAYGAIEDYLRLAQIDKINILIATHPHADHIGGMQKIVENYDIEQVYMPRTSHSTKTYRDLLEAIQAKGLKVQAARGGSMRFIELSDDLLIRMLGPVGEEYQELNDYSVVLHVTYQDTRFLFTGDIEKTAEQELLEKYAHLLEADVLKVAHHGSGTSSTEEFIGAAAPDFAVIPVLGGNSYNHPHKDVIARLNQHKITHYRTDLFGVIRFTSDGTNISVSTQRG